MASLGTKKGRNPIVSINQRGREIKGLTLFLEVSAMAGCMGLY